MRRARPLDQVQRTPRAEKINERYYARYNEPSFYQFGNDYHFTDSAGRLYQIANRNSDSFQNRLLREAPDTDECVDDGFGNILLYVKLKRRDSVWFDENMLERPLTIVSRRAPRTEYQIRVQSTVKPDARRRTGVISVSGLSRTLCQQMLADGQQQRQNK